MTLFQDFELVLGAILVVLVLHDVFQGVVVPRWSSRRGRIAPMFIDRLWPLWRRWGERKPHGDAREDWLGTYAPLALMLILVVWVGILVLGFGLIFWALRYHFEPDIHSFGEALYVAGVSLLTIGYGDYTPTDSFARVFALIAGASGLAVFALVISLLFTLYTAFERREVLSLQLDARGGSPPSGVALLERYSQLGLLDTLPDFFRQWEEWSAQILQSHIAYPILPFFRSSHDNESWIASLGAVLDSATLLTTTIQICENCGRKPIGAAQLMFQLGTHTVIDLSHWFGFRFDETEAPPVGVERGEWDAARARLARAGFALRPEAEAWEAFKAHRSQYAAGLNELAKHFAAPPAQWVGDRSMLDMNHRAPKRKRKPNLSLNHRGTEARREIRK